MYGLSTVDPPIYGDVISGYVVESISLAFAIYIAAAAVYDVIHLKKGWKKPRTVLSQEDYDGLEMDNVFDGPGESIGVAPSTGSSKHMMRPTEQADQEVTTTRTLILLAVTCAIVRAGIHLGVYAVVDLLLKPTSRSYIDTRESHQRIAKMATFASIAFVWFSMATYWFAFALLFQLKGRFFTGSMIRSKPRRSLEREARIFMGGLAVLSIVAYAVMTSK